MVHPNRLFFALLPPPETRVAIDKAVKDLSIMLPHRGKIVRPENLHLTLMFLGDAVPQHEEALALDAASSLSSTPLSLLLDQGATFAGNGALWWLGMYNPPEALLELRRQLQVALLERKVGYDRQRFAPHVTIVRNAKSRLPPTRIAPVVWNVGSLHLMRSPIGEAGGVYETVASWALEIRRTAPAGQLSLI